MSKKRVILIGCGVLRTDIEAIEKRLDLDIETEFLPGGLHGDPKQLRTRLQQHIDRASGSGEFDHIAVGYGICGRGTVGIYSRSVPLVIPKVHDCISLFMGSDEAYRREFSKCPGTFYISAGWYEEQVHPRGGAGQPPVTPEEELRKKDYTFFEEKYGEKNAREIVDFYGTWKKNYHRSAFIDTGAGNRPAYEEHASGMARRFGWDYERLEGSSRLMEQILLGDGESEEVLVVPPGHVTRYDPLGLGLTASPVREEEELFHLPAGGETRRITMEPPKKTGTGDTRKKGLGIDAGGTYTDAAVFDFETRKVLFKGKALTTRWDFTVGIGNALETIRAFGTDNIDLVSLSTTLATNAIVEGQGQKVGLILMPPACDFDRSQISNDTVAVVSGKLSIDGNVAEDVDRDEVRKAALRMAEKEKVGVFAVSGYAGSINPQHELEVRDILKRETGLHVCCGHELSDLLNFYLRANTAVLNARIIPLLERFIDDIEITLKRYGVKAPLMVVKGDGSLMTAAMAKERPIETALSGPAASIAGARYLTELDDAVVLDVGGTTSDFGSIVNGKVEVCEKGAKVGGTRTHVRALDMSTVGLGGDSRIIFEEQSLKIGPRRIAPMSWLGSAHSIDDQLTHIEDVFDSSLTTTRPLEFLARTGRSPERELSKQESALLSALEKGPCSTIELAARLDMGHWLMVHTSALESSSLIQRCGLTPTDILHVTGDIDLWERESAERIVSLYARFLGMDIVSFCSRIMKDITDRLIVELVKKQLDITDHSDSIDSCPACSAMMENILSGGNGRLNLQAVFQTPLVGLGGPVSFFTKNIPERTPLQIVIPPHSEVANAIGAITSGVTVSKRLAIVTAAGGAFRIQGVAASPDFRKLKEAHSYAVGILHQDIVEMARAAGTSEERVEIDVVDKVSTAADGMEVFLERTLTAEVTGIPDLA